MLVSRLQPRRSAHLTDDGLVPPDVPVGTRGAPLARGPHVKLADGGAGLVHAGEGQGLGPQLLGEGHLQGWGRCRDRRRGRGRSKGRRGRGRGRKQSREERREQG